MTDKSVEMVQMYPYTCMFYPSRNKVELSVNSSFLTELNDPSVQDEMLEVFERMADRHINGVFDNTLYSSVATELSKLHTELMSKNPKYRALSQAHEPKGVKTNAL